MGRGNQYIQLVKVLYCKLPTNGKVLPAFPLEVGPGTEPQSHHSGTVVPWFWFKIVLIHSIGHITTGSKTDGGK